MPSPFSVDGSYSFLGERHPAVDGQTLDVISPVDGSLVGYVASGPERDGDLAAHQGEEVYALYLAPEQRVRVW